jgi:hypothetical protein
MQRHQLAVSRSRETTGSEEEILACFRQVLDAISEKFEAYASGLQR